MNRYFVIFSGQAASLLGSEIVQFSLIWWLTNHGGTATTLAVAAAAGLLPPILLGPFAGAFVDRRSRKAVLIASDAAIAAATLALAVLFALGQGRKEYVYAAIFARAVGSAFHWPAMQAATASLVPQRQLGRIAGLNQSLRGAASIAMPPFGALLVTILPIEGVLSIDIITALVAVATLVGIRIPEPEIANDGAKPSLLSDMRDGALYVARWRALAILIALIAFLHFLAAPAFALVPIVAVRVFRGGALGMAWLQSASGLGLLAGGLVLGIWGGFGRRVYTVLAGIGMIGLCFSAFGALGPGAFVFAAAAIFAAGAFASMAVGSFQAIQLAVVPRSMQGRVFALSRSGIDAMSPLGLALAGPIADRVGLSAWYLAAGIAMAATAAAAAFVPALKRIEETE